MNKKPQKLSTVGPNNYSLMTDDQLIKAVVNEGDGKAFEEICKKYENIFYKVCQKYSAALSVSGVDPNDIFSEKNFIIFHCIRTFDPARNTKLSTWIGNYARYLCLNSINDRRFIFPSRDNDVIKRIEDDQVSQNHFKSAFGMEDFLYVSNLISQLKDKRVGEIFKYRYFMDKKWKWAKIADQMNISTQTAINLHNKGINMLRRKVKSKTISDVV